MDLSDLSSPYYASAPRRPVATPSRRLVLVLVLCAHGYALSRLMHPSPIGLPETGAERVLQVSWISGSDSEAQAAPSAAAASMPLPPMAPAKPERPHPFTAKHATKTAAKSARSTVRDDSAAASAAESVAATTGSPAHADSRGAGIQGAGASAADAGASGTQGFSAPRFDVAYLSNPPPEYPAASREMGEEGRVYLRVQVSPQGRALEIGVHKSSGHARLDTAALQAVRRWQFVPGRMGGEPVVAHVIVPINFFLE